MRLAPASLSRPTVVLDGLIGACLRRGFLGGFCLLVGSRRTTSAHWHTTDIYNHVLLRLWMT